MKVYFTAAITHRDRYQTEYEAIKNVISSLGHTYLESYDVMNEKLEKALDQDPESQYDFYQKWIKTIAKADVAVVEASFPSTVHIGFEIANLLDRGRPTIVLHTRGNDPKFASENHSPRMIKSSYTKDDIKEVLQWALAEAEQLLNRRFTFFISPEIDTYLEKINKKKGLSKSEFIRELIEEKMKSKD